MNDFEDSDRLNKLELKLYPLTVESTLRYAEPAGLAFTNEWSKELKKRSERINPGIVHQKTVGQVAKVVPSPSLVS